MQADLGLCCPLMPEDRFSLGVACLMLSMLGKDPTDNNLKYFFSFFPKKDLTFPANCLGDILQEISKPLFWEK